MQDESLKIVVSGLLHDIGKIVYRTGDGRQHSLTGMEFLRDEAGIHDKSILEAVRYHHGAELRGAHIPNDSPAYIIYIADNIASASDRRKSDGKESGFDRQVPLESIFNILNGNHGNKHYHPEALNESKKANMPTDKPIVYDSSFYTHTRNALLDTLKGVDVLDRSYIHSLLETMEAHTSFIPSSTAIHELADISLFDHSKMTAAMASCIYEYLEERKERDYKSRLFERAKDFYDEKAFQLVSMDISGIQKFIYTIHSKNALKMLRGRSFYLEILMEHMIDELLEAMDLTRANLIYSGGGHCYILAPNTEAARNMIVGKNKEFNDFFLKQFDVALYVASAYVPCSAHELENIPEGTYAPLFRTLSEQLSEQKMKRYSSSQIMELNRRSYGEGRRECRVCKTSSNLNEEGICQFCRSMESLSSKVLYAECFSVFAREDSRKIPLPCGKTLFAQSEEELRKSMKEDGAYVRAYRKNRLVTGQSVSTHLWAGDYTIKGMSTEEYADVAQGIDRIAVLRADVDNLGQAFVAGFEDRYTTLSRTATLSRQLSLFFKHHINQILADGEFGLRSTHKGGRNATIVYSGGDDLFIVGAWNDVIELAVDIRNKLNMYSEGMLTISAGIGIYPAKYPLSRTADETASLEDVAKGYPDVENPKKNAIALFDKNNVYSWDEFVNSVVGEKLKCIERFFETSDERGKAFLYHLLELIRNMDDRINLARYAYVLTRLEPTNDKGESWKREDYRDFARRMYAWVQDDRDRKELVTAIYLYVYLTREKEENRYGNIDE